MTATNIETPSWWKRIVDLLDMIRFSHTLFALPFALLAGAMAWTAPATIPGAGEFRWLDLLGILVCMTAARTAAMAFNRLVDRDVDAENPRTSQRHLPAGKLSVGAVAWFAVASALLFIAGTLLFLPNWLPLVLALPVLAILLGYSFAKRFTSLAHLWLGTALMLAPVSAWIAIRGAEVLANPTDLLAPGLLGLAVLAWVTGFDIIYACQDAQFDAGAGLHSIPAALGVPGALRVAAGCHALMLGLLLALGWTFEGFTWPYWLALLGVAGLLGYEHALVRPDDLSRVNEAFFHVNAVVSVGLLIVGCIDLWWI